MVSRSLLEPPLPPAPRYTRMWWADWLVIGLMLAVLVCSFRGSKARGAEPDPRAKAAAALELAKAQRERETKAAVAAAPCFNDYGQAAAAARKAGKPLVVWIGLHCTDRPAFRAPLGDAVHCHVDLSAAGEWREPAVIFSAQGGKWYRIDPAKLDADRAGRVKTMWAPPPPPTAPPAEKVETLSRAGPPPVHWVGPPAAPVQWVGQPITYAAEDCQGGT
jgi:hypothetical protein